MVEGSPADTAGLKAGDRIRRFGTANWMNHEKLAKVAEVVQGSEGVSSSHSLPFSPVVFFPCRGSKREKKIGDIERLTIQTEKRARQSY